MQNQPTTTERYRAPSGYERSSFHAMGTTIVLVTREDATAEAYRIVRDLFTGWEQTLSRFRAESELSRLNMAAGFRRAVSPLLLKTLVAALDAARATRGVYDPTVQQRMLEIGYDRSFDKLAPSAPESIYARPAATGGWRQIEVDEYRHMVRLPAGVGLDFGGIGKGLAVDAALDALEQRGLTPALLNAGGDLAARGLPAGASNWAITVPGKDEAWVIGLEHGAVATSGVGRRRWMQGERARHHLIDPRTGEPAESGMWSVTAIAANCARAEVAAKTALILGPDEGVRFIEEIHLGALMIPESGEWRAVGMWPRDGMRPATEDAMAWQGELS
ncbi:MAG TPA: FAD:protein FMN transferase [Ktedonobacterales bacterium]